MSLDINSYFIELSYESNMTLMIDILGPLERLCDAS